MLHRRDVLRWAAAAGLATSLTRSATAAEPKPTSPSHAKRLAPTRLGGSQRRWRTAIGLNGFQSSESSFHNTFPIWEVLEFAQREGFDGVELCPGWLKGVYPDAGDDARIGSLKDFFARYHLQIFAIQTFGAEAFHKERSVREGWLKQFANWARFARKAGCECLGYWPMGELEGQSLDEAADHLVGTLKEASKILADEQLLLSVEIEPPFAFHTIDILIRLIDGVDHPLVRGQCDPSHFDLMNGASGKPHEALEKFGVGRLGYIHFTDGDGTLFHNTSRHLPAGEGHLDLQRLLEVLWDGGYQGWLMIDAWDTPDPYLASRKGKAMIDRAYQQFTRRSYGREAG